MSRKVIIPGLLSILAAVLTIIAAVLPDAVKEQYSWILQVLIGVVGLLILTIIIILLPKKLWQRILDIFPVRIIRTLTAQARSPGSFLYVQKPRFTFLYMSGGVNYRKWDYEFSIISCLLCDLKVDKIELELTYPIEERAILTGDICIKHLGATKLESGQGNMSDTSFHYLANQAKNLKKKERLEFRLKIRGFYNGKKKFVIEEDLYEGWLNEWGQNNP